MEVNIKINQSRISDPAKELSSSDLLCDNVGSIFACLACGKLRPNISTITNSAAANTTAEVPAFRFRHGNAITTSPVLFGGLKTLTDQQENNIKGTRIGIAAIMIDMGVVTCHEQTE
jgi:hypothetical protein